MTRTCPYPDCDQVNLSNDDGACPACGRPVYFMGGHDYTELIADRAREFIGREWVFAAIDRWLADPAGQHVFFLGGGPGSGKSAIAAQLVRRARGEVVADAYPALAKTGLAFYQFCQAQNDPTLDPLSFVKTLSLQLAHGYPPFAELLIQVGAQHPSIQVRQDVGSMAAGGRMTGVAIQELVLGNLSPRIAFQHVVRTPLVEMVRNGFADTILVLVDALDETLTYDPADNLVRLLADITDHPQELPAQMRFLVTSRPDPRVVDLMGDPTLTIVDDAPDNLNDVQAYAYRRLAYLVEPQRSDWAKRIAETGEGNFLYARYVLDDLPADLEKLAQLTLPKDLDDVYRRFLKRELGRQGRTWREYRPLMGLLVVARGTGLTRDQLAGILAQRPSALESVLEPCMQYLNGPFPAGPFRIYHQSFRDFLLKDPVFQVFAGEAHTDIADYYWKITLDQETAKRDWSRCDRYGLENLATHLYQPGQFERLASLIDPSWMAARFESSSYTYDGFLADLNLAWRQTHDETLQQIDAGKEPAALADCVRYALIRTSINSLSANYVP